MPPCAVSKTPLLGAHRVGEGAAGVAEEVRKQQRLGERGAVHRHPGRAGTAAHAAQLAGGELLAAAALAEKEHRHVARGELAQALDGGEQQRTLTDHAGCGGAVGMSATAAYHLRRRPEAQAFRLAWDAALDFGVRRLEDSALSRAIHGVARPVFFQGQQIGERRPVAGQTLQILAQRRPLPGLAARQGRGVARRAEPPEELGSAFPQRPRNRPRQGQLEIEEEARGDTD